MASAVEQFASNLNFGAFSKAQELKQRLWFMLLALLIYRVGTHIPLPGIDPTVWNDIFSSKSGGVLDMFNMFSGGALERMSILALNIMPYISASIIMQIMTSMNPTLEAMKKEGEAGRKRLNQYTRYGTVILAGIQAYGLAVGLESLPSSSGASAVINPGLFFRITTIITVVGGTVFLMWLGEQITQRGVGNGISLIIFCGIVAGIPSAVAKVLELGRTGDMTALGIVLIAVMVAAVLIFIVFMERAQRRVLVQYPKRMVGGNRMTGGETSHMPLKLNTAGVIPAIFASSLLLMPLSIVQFTGVDSGSEWMSMVSTYLGHGQPAYMALYGGLIVFFAFFYTAIVFNPDETADNLRKSNGFIPGIRPGAATAEYLDRILTRITVIGAAYLTCVCLLPELLVSKYSLPFYLGGTSLLIAVTVPMDTVAQIHSHLIAHQYEGLIKKSKLRGSRK